MNNQRFGSYLKELRLKKKMSQEQLAMKIERQKMTISQFEIGKNAPPSGKLLEKIIWALDLNKNDSNRLRFLAAKERKTVPNDLGDYLFTNPVVCEAIRLAKEKSITGEDLMLLISSFSENDKRVVKG